MQSEQLLDSIISSTTAFIKAAEDLKAKSDAELNWKASPESWSILECVQHLNLYSDFYLPEIQKAIKNSTFMASEEFKSGVLG